jgi:hypothetical protein
VNNSPETFATLRRCRRCILRNFGDYFMSGSIWRKFNSKFPDVPFDVFMSRKIEKCEKKNLDAKHVFSHARNRLCHNDTHCQCGKYSRH